MKFLGDIDLNQNQLLNPVLHIGTIAPSSPVPGQFWYNSNTDWNILMFWDVSRTSWLSVETIHYLYGRAANNTSSQYLRTIETASSNVINPIIRRDFTIVAMSSSTNVANTATFSARTKDTSGVLSGDVATLTQTNSRVGSNNALNVPLPSLMGLAGYVSGTGLNNPALTIFLKYRWA